ncbi:MAG: proton-conducting transporter membrane subunit [Deferrisomatales bacterium]
MLPFVVLFPFAAAALGFLPLGHRSRTGLLVGASLVHSAAVVWLWSHPPAAILGDVLHLDALGLLVLSVVSGVNAVVALYAPVYLARKGHGLTGTYAGCVLALLGAMSLGASTRHFGILWVAVEASTLASAPLISHRITAHKLEATWKYLVLCSVGEALALLGTFFLGLGATGGDEPVAELSVSALTAVAPHMAPAWLRAAMVLLAVGYGTKMGLAPFHSWVPDAYAEAPSPASALLSGALSNVAFLGILRVLPVARAGGQGAFAEHLLLVLGFASLALAAGLVLRQADFKRMLAYSSIENYGILALGVGLGGLGTYGALLHAVNHALAKTLLFLAAGNLLVFCGTRSVAKLQGVARRAPFTAALLSAGFLAIVGTPPFGPFWSELTVFRAALERPWAAVAFLALLGIVFVGMAQIVLSALHGRSPDDEGVRESWSLVAPPAVLAVALLGIGLVVPGPLHRLLEAAARSLGG